MYLILLPRFHHKNPDPLRHKMIEIKEKKKKIAEKYSNSQSYSYKHPTK